MIPGIVASRPRVVSGGGGGTIPFEKVALLLHFDGSDGSPTLVDSSRYGRIITNVGGEIDTAQSVFGGASGYVAHSTSGWYLHADADIDMSGAFLFDARVRIASGVTLADDDSSIDTIIAMVDGTAFSYEWAIILHRTYIRFYCGIRGTNNRTTRFFLPPGLDFADFDGLWAAVSIGRDDSGNWGAWLEGQRCPDYQTGNFSSSVSFNPRVNGAILNDATNFGLGAGHLLHIGRFHVYSGLAQQKHLDEIQLACGSGVCRDVSSNYTPDAAPFSDGPGSSDDPYFPYVISLINPEGSPGDTTIPDVTGRVWTGVGNTQIDTSLGYPTLKLDGAGDYAYSATDVPSAFGTGDFTVEAYIYLTAYPSAGAASIFETLPIGGAGSRNNSHAFYVGNTGTLYVFSNGSNILAAGTIPLNTLTHVKWSRFGLRSSIGINGVETGATTYPVNDSLGGFTIGTLADNPAAAGVHLPGHYAALRVTRGVDRYPQAAYTPDSFPFPES